MLCLSLDKGKLQHLSLLSVAVIHTMAKNNVGEEKVNFRLQFTAQHERKVGWELKGGGLGGCCFLPHLHSASYTLRPVSLAMVAAQYLLLELAPWLH